MDNISKHKTRKNCKLNMGLDEFIDMVFADKSVDARITCPCKNCGNERSVTIKVAKDHLKAVGFIEGCAKIACPAKFSSVPSHSQTSGENMMNLGEDANDIKLFNDFEEGLLPPGLKERKLCNLIAKLLHLKRSENDLDKSDKSLSSLLLEFAKEFFLVQDGADPPKSFGKVLPILDEAEDQKIAREKQNHPSAYISFGCEEEDKTTLGETRNQPSASTSSGLVGYSTKEENRRKLREKINQRKESRWRIR